ncbi:hypothetical protein DRN82_06615 [Thermococci archaeon]|nr:MAG: hypothetical protein DRN82_06615 [Thermococci archaeon]
MLPLKNNVDLVILDDKEARKIARKFELKVMGTLGVLLLAKERGLISQVKPYIEMLRKRGFRISDTLVRKILKSAGEI